ncbi:MAG TPA: nucleotide exchange factor GrpE [Anaerolineae bacterium]|nr:nucleotide exchange factor GrpE [Anaerolineae bacterium]HXK42969.1 nucleotide exchange factor GrpE [Anaerolineae bacterium]
MNEHRAVWTTLGELLQRLEKGIETNAATQTRGDGLAELEQEIHKLGKTQFKANTLAAEQAERLAKAVELLEEQQQQLQVATQQLVQAQVTAAHREWLMALLPVLDGLDHAISSGERYLQRRDLAATVPNLTPEQAQLVSPADRAMLAGWLEGLQLLRERLLALLEAEGVTPIPTVGELFDPYRHVVVATTTEGATEPGRIVAEERRGYCTAEAVLRFAEVVVYKPAPPDKSSFPQPT